MKRMAILALLLALLAVAVTAGLAAAQGGTWETKAPMPTARHGAAGGVINGKLYVAGGHDGTQYLATLEVYDPATNTWASLSPMLTAQHSVGGGVINGKLYVVGGIGAGNQKLATLEVYDPATNTWTTKAPMPTARSGAGVVAIDGKLYVVGGCVGWCAPTTAVLEVYDPATDTWTTKASMPTARGVADVAVVDGLLYVMGGCCGWTVPQSEQMSKTIEVYNPTTNTWTTKTQHLVGAGDTAGSINEKIYVAKFADSEVYDPATDTWASLSPMPTARYYAAGGVINGKLYVAGGYYETHNLATLEAFTPEVTEITVTIDIKPGSFPNSINPRSKGRIPVAILTTDPFDATTVDPTTVLFGPTGTEAAPVQSALEDVDGDGDTDMILHFNTQDTGIVCGVTSASLTGETFAGQAIRGSDSINTAGCK
ncbi:MAG: hypothetical protein HY535_08205 [Chloroflexi bacterium]|nr:hypothetical protein [Chloroflexota bacterium]